MGSYFRPQESSSQVTLERYLLATDFISGIGYGAQGVLYIICARYLWNQRKARRINMFMLAYTTVLFLISSVEQVAQAHRMQLVFIDNRNSPGGPWGYYLASIGGTSSMVNQGASVALLFLSELFMVWRCWVVWSSVGRHVAYTVALFPLLMLMASLAGAILDFLSDTHPASEVAGASTASWALTYYALMFGTNVIVTVLILTRLIAHRRFVHKNDMHPHAMRYTSLITILIESCFFYSIVGAPCLIITGVGAPISGAFVSVSRSMQQIAGYLLIVRVANGKALDSSVLSTTFVVRHPRPPSERSMSDEEQDASVQAKN